MYECPNCGGNLKFSIEDQLMKCDYCQTTFDPYSLKKENDAEELFAFEATIFTCPQCGGEILSTDNSAASVELLPFCPAGFPMKSGLYASFPLKLRRIPVKRLILAGCAVPFSLQRS